MRLVCADTPLRRLRKICTIFPLYFLFLSTVTPPAPVMLFGMKTSLHTSRLAAVMLGSGVAILAFEPLRWLVNSWFEPSYASDGGWVFLLFCVLLLWSVSSPRSATAARYRTALLLLAATALVRLAGQVLAIHVVGALALVVDVYALGLLLGLSQRRRPLSPLWLALLFACALPLERILQRTLGYALQTLSAWSSCAVLTGVDEAVVCNGTRVQLPNTTLLIDLPCSGASALVLLTVLLTTLMAVARPGRKQALLALLIVPLAAWLSNSLRILSLALGVMYPLPGVDVMQQPWHELVGLLSLLPALALLLRLFLALHRPVQSGPPTPAAASEPVAGDTARRRNRPTALPSALAFLLLSLVIVTRSAQPLDAGHALEKPYAPRFLAGDYGQEVALLDKERRYFEQFGGTATKIQYGARGLLITRTQSPLRHLHAPDECLRGLGFAVTYLGSQAAPLPTAVYRATAPDGTEWKVAVSFLSTGGETASNVAEAVWKWFQAPRVWTAVQRISPWDSSPAADAAWDRQLFAALDYPLAHPSQDASPPVLADGHTSFPASPLSPEKPRAIASFTQGVMP